MKKMYLVAAIITTLVFAVLLIEVIEDSQNLSQIGLKEIIYLIGWLLLAISTSYQYFNQK